MKNHFRWLIAVLTTTISPAFAQKKANVQELALLSKTWGLLKYYHPGIATGRCNWDSVLVAATNRMLLPVQGTSVQTEIDHMLALAGKDDAPERLPEPRLSIERINYDISWIKTSKLLSKQQRGMLNFIATHPYPGTNDYAQPDSSDDNQVHTPNEKPYKDMLMPDVHYRLLSLFRFWNLINYYYPYKYLVGKPWDHVQLEFIPQMLIANDTLTYYQTLAKMAASINDSHGGLWPWVYQKIVGKYGPGFYFRIVDQQVVVTRMKNDSMSYKNIRTGTIIDKIDGIAINERITQYSPYIAASNEASRLRDLHHIILRSHNNTAMISGQHPDGKRFEERISLTEPDFLKDYAELFDMYSPVISKIVAGGVGYVVFGNITKRNIDSVMLPLMNSKAIIFDMRKNMTNGYGVYTVPSYLLNQPAIYSKLTRPDYALPGMFRYEVANLGTNYETVGKNNPHPYRGKVILLVNECTQSVMEWACMTMKTAPNVTVIGSQTAGADGNVTRTVLPGNYKINFSGLGIYYPDGTQTQRIGIHVDIPVKVTIDDLILKRDPALVKAIEFANVK